MLAQELAYTFLQIVYNVKFSPPASTKQPGPYTIQFLRCTSWAMIFLKRRRIVAIQLNAEMNNYW